MTRKYWKMRGKGRDNKYLENVQKMTGNVEQIVRFNPKNNSQNTFNLENQLRTPNYLRNRPVTSQKALTATIFKPFLEAFSESKSIVFWCTPVTIHR